MASSGVNVKMGVSGIAQFKQNMNQAKQAVKTLDAQIALSEKQFKATGDAESFMTEKSELLKAKLEQQKNVVAQAESALKAMSEKGVDKSSKAYQEMYRQMLAAKGEMIDTENEMNGIASACEEAAGGVDAMNDSLKAVGKNVSWQNISEGLTSITSGMEKVMKKAWEMGEAIVRNTLGAGSWADELMTTAAAYREIDPTIDAEKLQRMRKTAQLIDTDVDSIISSKQKLASAMGKKDIDDIFAEFGIYNTRYGEFENLDDMFWSVGEALMKIDNETKRAQLGKKLFGNWTELAPLFAAGREEYQKTMDSWNVVEQEQLDALGKMDDQYQKLTGEWETFKMEILSTFAGPMTTGMEKLTTFVQELNNYLDSPEGQAMLKQMGDTVTQLIEDLTNVSPEDVVNGLKGVVDGVKDGLQWIADNKDKVTGAVKAFIGAWAVAKTSAGIATVMKLINGITGLGAGGGTIASGAGAAGATAGSSFAASFANAFVATAPAIASVLGVTAVAILPALMANVADDKRVEEKRQTRLTAATQLNDQLDRDFLERSANALGTNWHGGNEAEVEAILMGIKDRSDLQLSQLHTLLNEKYTTQGNYTWNELQALWNGTEDFDQARLNATLESVTDAYTRMSERTDELTGSTESQTKASGEVVKAANAMQTIPDEVYQSVRDGMSGIVFELDGKVITEYVNKKMGEDIDSERR